MGKDTVQNQNRSVATQGSLHVARTQGPCDMCHPIPDPSKVQGFANWVPTTKLAAGKTNITLIASHSIWTEPGEIGPPSNDAHPPFTMGVTSKMLYRQEAKATSWSADVFAEGNAMVRSNDCTTMNHANTTGYVDGSALGEGADNAEPWVKDKCGIVKLKGVQGGGKSARELGFEKGKTGSADERHYIEVLAGDTVELEVTREDLTKAGQEERDPACAKPGEHAKWLITKARGDQVDEETIEGKDKIDVDADDAATWITGTIEGIKHGGISRTSEYDGGTTEVGDGALTTWAAVVQFFRYRKNPYTITCLAQACAGNRKADIKVFPKEKVEFSIALGEKETGEDFAMPGAWGVFVRVLAGVKKVVEWVDKLRPLLAKKGGSHGGYLASADARNKPIEFLVGAKATVKVNYERIGKAQYGYRKEHVGMPWGVTITAGPLLHFNVTWRLSLITCTLSLVGKVAAWVLERLAGAGLDLVLTFLIDINLDVDIGVDAYWRATKTGVSVPLTLRFEAGLEVTFTKWAVRGGMGVSSTLRVGIFLADDNEHLCEIRFSGEATPDFFVRVTKRGDVKFEKKIVMESWQIKPDVKPIKLLSMA